MPLFSQDFEVISQRKKKVFIIQRADFDNIGTLLGNICTLLTFQCDLDGPPEVHGLVVIVSPVPPLGGPAQRCFIIFVFDRLY